MEDLEERKIVIVDLDGTLANIDHRAHLVRSEKPDWVAFYKACVNDKPNRWCVKIIDNVAPAIGVRLMIVSARSKAVESETRDWLNRYVNAFFHGDVELVMLREDGDHTEDTELKRRWLASVGGPAAVLFAIDDRQKVVDMWRREGVVCLQAYAWEEFGKEPKDQKVRRLALEAAARVAESFGRKKMSERPSREMSAAGLCDSIAEGITALISKEAPSGQA